VIQKTLFSSLVQLGYYLSKLLIHPNAISGHEILPRLLVDIFFPAVQIAGKIFYGYTEINPIDV
jgi:hypothetical protein